MRAPFDQPRVHEVGEKRFEVTPALVRAHFIFAEQRIPQIVEARRLLEPAPDGRRDVVQDKGSAGWVCGNQLIAGAAAHGSRGAAVDGRRHGYVRFIARCFARRN